jgi:D-arabinose 1-dehydrogenase-like Zn-dependent alcohol dehydrogenase
MSDIPKTSKPCTYQILRALELLDMKVPELAPGDMLVKVRLASVCCTDVHLHRDVLR